MQRVLTFDGDETVNQTRFALFYDAILYGAQTQSRGGGIDVLRKEASILNALDLVSAPDASLAKLPNGDVARRVTPGAVLILPQHEHELLKKRLEEGPWLPHAARRVVDAVDWLTAAPEHLEAVRSA